MKSSEKSINLGNRISSAVDRVGDHLRWNSMRYIGAAAVVGVGGLFAAHEHFDNTENQDISQEQAVHYAEQAKASADALIIDLQEGLSRGSLDVALEGTSTTYRDVIPGDVTDTSSLDSTVSLWVGQDTKGSNKSSVTVDYVKFTVDKGDMLGTLTFAGAPSDYDKSSPEDTLEAVKRGIDTGEISLIGVSTDGSIAGQTESGPVVIDTSNNHSQFLLNTDSSDPSYATSSMGVSQVTSVSGAQSEVTREQLIDAQISAISVDK